MEDVAVRRKWNSEDKLDALLLRLRGRAGEFVFGQQPPRVRSDYKGLKKSFQRGIWQQETAHELLRTRRLPAAW